MIVTIKVEHTVRILYSFTFPRTVYYIKERVASALFDPPHTVECREFGSIITSIQLAFIAANQDSFTFGTIHPEKLTKQNSFSTLYI